MTVIVLVTAGALDRLAVMAPTAELLVGGKMPLDGVTVAEPSEVKVSGQTVVETGTMEV